MPNIVVFLVYWKIKITIKSSVTKHIHSGIFLFEDLSLKGIHNFLKILSVVGILSISLWRCKGTWNFNEVYAYMLFSRKSAPLKSSAWNIPDQYCKFCCDPCSYAVN